MQEAAVGWDPNEMHVQLPWGVQLYVLLICLFVLFFSIRALLIVWDLWLRPLNLRRDNLSGPEKIKQFARAWLKGVRLEIDPMLQAHAAAQFQFLASMIKAELRSARRIAIAIVLFGAGVAGIRTLDLLQEVASRKVFPLALLGGSIAEFLAAPMFGCIVAGCVYLVSGVLESRLARREAAFQLSHQAGISG